MALQTKGMCEMVAMRLGVLIVTLQHFAKAHFVFFVDK